MGGAGIGVGQYLSINSLNPAAVRLKGFTMISASFQGEMVDNTVSGSTVTTRQGNAAGFQFAVPIYRNRIAILASLKPLVKSQLTVDFASQHENFDMLRTVRTSGGISAASIGLNYAVLPGIFIGGLFNFNFGAYNEIWKTDFDNDTYRNTEDDVTSHLWGTGAELGVLIRPVSFFSVVGVIWRPILASIIMFFVVKLCHQDNLDYIVLRLLMDVSIGAVAYIGSMYLLWVMTGRSMGVEQTVISRVSLFFDRKKAQS